MCGLIGYVGRDLEAIDIVDRGLPAIDHRGPDARGVRGWSSNSVSCRIAHTRLRIVDVRQEADQPMSNEDGTVWVAFNGEIYNHPELRSELSSSGHRFSSRSDTEVLVHLYEAVDGDPERMLSRLRGMFAFALWDQTRGRLFIARDRLGIKPLYWRRTSAGIAFASEVGALVASGLAGRSVDERSLADFLVYGRIAGTSSPIEGVRALPAGSYVMWNGEGAPPATATMWWHLPLPTSGRGGRDGLYEALRDSVGRHIQADRPVGIFLSGGIDSWTVTALAAEAGATGTLTVSWPEVGGDEAADARDMAKRLGVEHREVPYGGRDIVEAIPSALSAMDVPTGDGFNIWIVSKAARDAGYVVTLSGLGGDELFGGYPSFRQVPQIAMANDVLDIVPRRARLRLASALGGRWPGGRWARVLAGHRGLPSAYSCMRSVFSPATLIGQGVSMPFGQYFAGGRVSHDPLDSVTAFEFANYLPDQLLRDADQMSMAHSIELRVPLLDDDVVAAALELPSSERIGVAGTKGILRDVLPIASHPKRPFTLPFDTWMRGELRLWLRESLLSDSLPLSHQIPLRFRRKLVAAFEGGRTHWSRPWTVAVLRRWMELKGLDT